MMEFGRLELKSVILVEVVRLVIQKVVMEVDREVTDAANGRTRYCFQLDSFPRKLAGRVEGVWEEQRMYGGWDGDRVILLIHRN